MELKEIIEELTKNKNAEECFIALKNSNTHSNYPQNYRTALLLNYISAATSQVLIDSEHGVDGLIVLGSAEVWNKEEFSPWYIKEQTVILGNLVVEGTLNIIDGGTLYVAKDLKVEYLNILGGEVHCAGEIHSEKISQSKNSFLYASALNCKNIDLP